MNKTLWVVEGLLVVVLSAVLAERLSTWTVRLAVRCR
jgi:hypothetical protein